MRTVVVVQARMASTRLPGKASLDLCGEPVLARVLKRCQLIQGVDDVVAAIADTAGNAPLVEIARRCGAQVFEGSEADPLSRTLGAARMMQADLVVRVTSDCPLIDFEVCGEVVAKLKALGSNLAGYVSNVHPRTYPHGLDCEAMTMAILETTNDMATTSYDREHTTPFIRRTWPVLCQSVSNKPDASQHRWVLDTAKDLEFLRAIFAWGNPLTMRSVFGILEVNPEIKNPPA